LPTAYTCVKSAFRVRSGEISSQLAYLKAYLSETLMVQDIATIKHEGRLLHGLVDARPV
jgi:hypothetical protein